MAKLEENFWTFRTEDTAEEVKEAWIWSLKKKLPTPNIVIIQVQGPRAGRHNLIIQFISSMRGVYNALGWQGLILTFFDAASAVDI